MSFEKLNLLPVIEKALNAEGYTKPTPIQAQAIPLILQGKDVCGIAQTGTGKTAAFALPIIHLLQSAPLVQPRKIRALILTPTRELAIQIGESFAAYGKYTDLKKLVIYGGVGQKPQVDALRRGIDVLIATPGRLLDLMQQGFISLRDLEIFVLDEADRMLDMGFIHDIKKVVQSLPSKRQSLFFSATMPQEIHQLANTILTHPVKVEVTPASSTVDTIQQSVFHVSKANKLPLLIHLLEDRNLATVLVFTRTKHGADKVAKFLNKSGIQAEAIHGNKSQNARQRALHNFKNWKTRVLVATDIAARGIDIEELSHVVNFDIPNEPETYVHRIGRTGRAGAKGVAFAFCDFDEAEYMRDIHKLIAKKVPVNEEHPYAIDIPEHMMQPKVQVVKKRPQHKPHYEKEKRRYYPGKDERRDSVNRFERKENSFGGRREDEERGERSFGRNDLHDRGNRFGDRRKDGDRRSNFSVRSDENNRTRNSESGRGSRFSERNDTSRSDKFTNRNEGRESYGKPSQGHGFGKPSERRNANDKPKGNQGNQQAKRQSRPTDQFRSSGRNQRTEWGRG